MSGKAIGAVAAALVLGVILGAWWGRSGDGSEVSGPGQQAAAEPILLKMTSVFPATLKIVGDGGVYFADLVTRATGGRVEIRYYEPNKLVPPLEVFDAVSKGAVDAGYTSGGFHIGKVPSAVLFSSVPFGPDMAEYLAWIYEGGGLQIWQEIYARHNLYVEPCLVQSPEASGWFRKPIDDLKQLEGLKIRFYGLGGKVMQKLGASVQLLAPGDIFPALERGVLDAMELSMPVIDQQFGFYKIAKHYYFPGWHQQASIVEFIVNQERWKQISEQDKLIIHMACRSNMVRSMSLGESVQGPAIAAMQKEGVIVHSWTVPQLKQIYAVTQEVMAAESAGDPDFKRAYESLQAFRAQNLIWAKLSRVPPEVLEK